MDVHDLLGNKKGRKGFIQEFYEVLKWEKRIHVGIVLRSEDERVLKREDEMKLMEELFPNFLRVLDKFGKGLLNLFN